MTIVSQLITDARTRFGAQAVERIDVRPDLLDGAMDHVLSLGGAVGLASCVVEGVEVRELPEGQDTPRAWVTGESTPRPLDAPSESSESSD